jgi:hypothetical protein
VTRENRAIVAGSAQDGVEKRNQTATADEGKKSFELPVGSQISGIEFEALLKTDRQVICLASQSNGPNQ